MTSSTLSGNTPYHPANQSEAVIGGGVLSTIDLVLADVVRHEGAEYQWGEDPPGYLLVRSSS